MDREKVVKGIECCEKMGRLAVEDCRDLDCPYYESEIKWSCWVDVLTDTLELLKTQQTEIEEKNETIAELERCAVARMTEQQAEIKRLRKKDNK